MSVGTTKFTIVGLLSTTTVPGQEQVFVPLTSAQLLFAFPQQIDTIEGSFVNGADAPTVEAAIRKALGSGYQVGGVSSNSSLYAALGSAGAAFNIFGIFALITGGFIILNSFRTVVSERRHDVGMLRAIGAKRGTIVGMFLIESVFQGVLGTAIGLAVGYLTVFGSVVAFSAFAYLAKAWSPTRMSTYAYLNPLVAVLLGSAFLGEPFGPRILLGMAVILVGVALVQMPVRTDRKSAKGVG